MSIFNKSKSRHLILYVAVTFRYSCSPVITWRKVVPHLSTRNNCYESLASYNVIFQSDFQPCFKTPVCGAAFSYDIRTVWKLIVCRMHIEICTDDIHTHFFRYEHFRDLKLGYRISISINFPIVKDIWKDI